MKPDQTEDYKLLCHIKRGDEEAFRQAYVKYHKELYRVAIKYLRTKALAEDAVHDVYVKLWNRRKRLKKSGSLKGFLFTTVRNHVLNVIVRNKRELKRNIEFKNEKQQKIIGDDIDILAEHEPILNKAVELLPEKRRQVFNLRTKGGLMNKEVAKYLGISVHTVKSQYYKAQKFIKQYMREDIKTESR